ncbi:MAG: putative ABC transporter permease subunit [Bacillota bacterium]|jgi:hypothetical protein
MRASLRMLWISLKVRVRLTSPTSWLFIAIAAVIVPLFSFSLGSMVGIPSMVPQDLLPFLTGFLNVILFMQISTSFSSAFYHLYLSRDLPLLLASPSRPRSVILAKMLEVAGSGVLTYLAAGIPLLVALGKAWYAPAWYYILAAAAGLPFAMLPTVLAVLATLAVCRILPAYGTKEISAALGTLVGGLTYFFLRVAGSSEMWGQARNPSRVSLFFGKLGPSWSPSTLLARAVVEGLYERWLPLLASGMLFAGATFGVFRLVVAATEKAYLSGWATSREGRRGRKTHPVFDDPVLDSAPGRLSRPALGDTSDSALRPTPGHTGGPATDCVQPVSSAIGTARDLVRPSRLAVELKALSVESKLLFRDLQSQSQLLYLLIMIVAWRLFPGGNREPTENGLFALIPFFFLALSGSNSWSLKNMSQTVRILRQLPCDPARVMRGKAFFYGIIQTGCIAFLVGVLKTFGRFSVSGLPVLGTLWTALSFSTSATTVAAAAYRPEVSSATGIPRLDLGAGVAAFLANIVLCVISGFLYVGALTQSSPVVVWVFTGIALAVNAVAFVIATNMAGNMTRSSPTAVSSSPGTGGSK